MKLRTSIQLLTVAIALLFAGCEQEKEPIAVTGVTLSQSTLVITEGESHILTATVQPNDAYDKSVSWTTSNARIASVQDGEITAHQPGTATIVVTTKDGGKTAICEVTVNAKVINVDKVTLDKETLELVVGDEMSLNVTVSPDNATNKNVTWLSSDSEVVAVENGKVTAIKEGMADITVKTEDGEKTDTCRVTVSERVYPVESVSLDKTSVELTEGDEVELTATVSPENASNKNVTWMSSNTQVATVENGKVTAVKEGTAAITVRTEDGEKTDTCKVTVTKKVYPVESVSLDKNSIELTEGDEVELTATVSPDNASNKNVTWMSSNTQVATVENGKVTAVKEGTAAITVRTEDGEKTDTCKVTVTKKVYPVESVSLDKNSIELTVGSVTTLTATISPKNATNKNLSWSSSSPEIATVVDGKVTAQKVGKATIKVTTEDGNKTAMCEVTVKDRPKATSLTLNKDSFTAYIGDSFNIEVSVYPVNANYDLEWSVSDSRVVGLSRDSGLSTTIETKDYGTSKIIVRDKISDISASIEVSTTVENFTWQEESEETLYGYPLITIAVGEEYQLHYTQKPEDATRIFSDLSQVVFYGTSRPVDSQDYIKISEDGLVTGLKPGTIGIKTTGRIFGNGRVYIKVVESEISVEAITLNKTSLTLAPGTSYSLVAKVVPTNATDKTLTWSSSAYTVATVDESGVVTAVSDGTVTITAVAVGGASESCTVNVISLPSATATADYKDEYGVNHGKGIVLGGTVWAPVNCGYKAPTYDEDNNVTDKGFPYGKLYQWGRKYGQGYSEDYDSSVPTLEEGPVSMAYGQSESMSNHFFTSSSSPYDWVSAHDASMWNSGTDESPVRTDNDPCPKGWRVPTYSELEVLMTDYSDWTTVDGQKGYHFSGVSTTKYDTPPMGEDVKIFFPAAGYRGRYGDAYDRGYYGAYWSSDTRIAYANGLFFYSSKVYMSNYYRAYGFFVRCVQE